MNAIGAFFQLIRWPNLVFIAMTQVLFYYSIYIPLFASPQPRKLIYILIASLLIAAAGYIINDYFDLNIDRVNKPQQNVIDKQIHRRWAIIWHFIFSFFGVLFTALAVGLHLWYVILANIGCVILLWFYSTSLKKKLLIGNAAISLLTAWTILILFFSLNSPANAYNTSSLTSIKFFRLAFLYAGFAFIISLIREVIKDMEDMDGDLRYGCKTLPIVAGLRAAKLYTVIWITVLIATLIILQLYILQFGWWHSSLYGVLFVIIPLAVLLVRIRKSITKADFTKLSRLSKFIIFTGILSMLFFHFYF